MECEIVWTQRASADVEAIARYIRRRDPTLARRITAGIFERVQILANNPQAGSPLAELSEGGWRKLIYVRWKIIYAHRSERVIIGRIWPAALGEADLRTPL